MKLKRALRLCAALLLAAAVLVPYFIFENTALHVSEYALGGPALPAGFEGAVVAHISDFHNTHSETLRARLLRALEESKPDLIVMTGDLIDARRPDVDAALSFSEAVARLAPTYFVTGNHEAMALNEWRTLSHGLRAQGVTLLENDSAVWERGGDSVALQGISDPKFLAIEQVESVKAVTARLPAKQRFRILLAHRPEYVSVYAEAGFNLILSGHTHGGQIRLPFLGGLYAPGQGWFPKYDAGVYTVKDSVMTISRGIGNSRLPLRVNDRPELVLVRLTQNPGT